MKTELTPSQSDDLFAAFDDHATFCRESLRIRNPAGSSVPMELSPGQVKLDAAIKKQQARGQPVRLVVLKTRRSQFTSAACSEIFHEVAFFAGRRATIIADKYNPAGLEAFDYFVQFDLSYKPIVRHGHSMKKPRLTKPTKPQSPVPEGSSLQLLWENGASVDVLSAEGGDVGRGGGRHWLLGDEVAFWRAATVSLTGVLNMVPSSPETGVILQSTANGVGGEFFNLCQKAMDPADSGGWEFLFFGWLEHPPYRMELTGDEKAKLQASLDPEEKLLQSMHGAFLEQLAWRRKKIHTELRGDSDLFKQEYPTTPEEAFLASGRPVFDHRDLARHPVMKGSSGELEIVEHPPVKRLVFIPREEDRGSLTVWQRPEQGHMYTVGADPSKGIDVSTTRRGDNPDFSAAFVIDTRTGEQVALLRARIRPIAFAEQLALLGRWFNWAFLVPEANDVGFMDSLINTGYPLELIYNRQRDPTDRRPTRIQEIGFLTTGVSRTLLVGAAEEAIRSMTIQIHSSVVISECQTFVVKPNSKKEHQDGCHDDTVIALGLAELGRRIAPRKPPASLQPIPRRPYVEVGKRRRDEDDDD